MGKRFTVKEYGLLITVSMHPEQCPDAPAVTSSPYLYLRTPFIVCCKAQSVIKKNKFILCSPRCKQ